MKKKKIMASLVLSAMMVGTLGTSVSASTWKPEGTPGVSAVGGHGTGNGSGVVQREKVEHCFLVAVPTTMRRLSFFADPTGSTLDQTVGGTFQFQNEKQTWDGEEWIEEGRAKYSNYVAVYNAGSTDVTLSVTPSVTMRTISGPVTNGYKENLDDPLLKVNVTAAVVGQGGTATYDDVDDEATFDNHFHSVKKASVTDSTPKTWAREIGRDKWEVKIPAGTENDEWLISEDGLTSGGVRYKKYLPVTLEEYNAAALLNKDKTPEEMEKNPIAKDDQTINRFDYPAAVFRLYGEANHEDDATWDILDLTADLNLVWQIKDNSSVAPEIEQVVVVTDLVNGNKIPVSLGKGDKAMNNVSSVIWDVPAIGDQAAFQMELLGNFVKYVPVSGSEGNLVIDEEALRTWYNSPDHNPATLRVTMTKGSQKVTLSTVIFVY